MRFTKCEPSKNSMFPYKLRDEELSTKLDATHKLGRLEDVEELCKKIVSQPIYEKFTDTGEIHQENYTFFDALYNFEKKRIEIWGDGFVTYLVLDEYGKTWALTREELS